MCTWEKEWKVTVDHKDSVSVHICFIKIISMLSSIKYPQLFYIPESRAAEWFDKSDLLYSSVCSQQAGQLVCLGWPHSCFCNWLVNWGKLAWAASKSKEAELASCIVNWSSVGGWVEGGSHPYIKDFNAQIKNYTRLINSLKLYNDGDLDCCRSRAKLSWTTFTPLIIIHYPPLCLTSWLSVETF